MALKNYHGGDPPQVFRGICDRIRGYSHSRNPYRPGTLYHRRWLAGWLRQDSMSRVSLRPAGR